MGGPGECDCWQADAAVSDHWSRIPGATAPDQVAVRQWGHSPAPIARALCAQGSDSADRFPAWPAR